MSDPRSLHKRVLFLCYCSLQSICNALHISYLQFADSSVKGKDPVRFILHIGNLRKHRSTQPFFSQRYDFLQVDLPNGPRIFFPVPENLVAIGFFQIVAVLRDLVNISAKLR